MILCRCCVRLMLSLLVLGNRLRLIRFAVVRCWKMLRRLKISRRMSIRRLLSVVRVRARRLLRLVVRMMLLLLIRNRLMLLRVKFVNMVSRSSKRLIRIVSVLIRRLFRVF